MIRPGLRLTSLRNFSTSSRRLQQAVGVVGDVPVRRPVGGLRGGILGFLLGFAACSTLSIYYLQQENQVASSVLMSSVVDLQQGTEKITSHLDRLQSVEKDLAALKGSVAAKDDVGSIRGEMKKVYDSLHLEVLDLRAHVWGVEQDLQKVVKTVHIVQSWNLAEVAESIKI